MSWFWLILAGVFEIAWALSFKSAAGYTRPGPSLLNLVLLVLSVGCLAQALKTIPVGTGYAVWTGIGAVGAALFGIILFKEPATAARLLCIALIVAGIIGLKLTA